MADTFRKKLVLLGTGGTIAGLATDAHDNVAYSAGQVGIERLFEALPMARRLQASVLTEQVAQVDSKDMGFAVWRRLLQRCWFWLADPEVSGIVVTHGTDTMEETAFFLHTVLAQSGALDKPVVLTGSMRPGSSLSPDGPTNLLDALAVAADAGPGVMVSFAGNLHSALDVQKVHPYRLDPFDSGEAGALGQVEEGRVRLVHAPPLDAPAPMSTGLSVPPSADRGALWRAIMDGVVRWPRVEIVMSHSCAGAFMVDALLAYELGLDDRLRGIVVAATGNGSVHEELESVLLRAQASGIVVIRASRCGSGRIVAGRPGALADSAGLSPVKARIALALELMLADAGARKGD